MLTDICTCRLALAFIWVWMADPSRMRWSGLVLPFQMKEDLERKGIIYEDPLYGGYEDHCDVSPEYLFHLMACWSQQYCSSSSLRFSDCFLVECSKSALGGLPWGSDAILCWQYDDRSTGYLLNDPDFRYIYGIQYECISYAGFK